MRLPEVVTDLTAERIGSAVRLRWTTSSKTTDGLNMDGAVTAQVCRTTIATAAACVPVRRIPVRPGPSEAADALPAALLGGPETVLAYRVELLNAGERSAGPSSPVLVAGGAAPPPISELQVEAKREGVLLRWRAENAADAVEVERVQLNSAAKPAKRPALGPPASDAPLRVRLRADGGGTGEAPVRADAGGIVDTTAVRGQTYTYTAQRVRRVVLDGHALELRGAVSLPVTVTVRDVFPPQPPQGVEAIAGESGGIPGIDLSWIPNTEDDLAGYLVYRREAKESDEICVTPSLVRQPGFRDTSVKAAHTYSYIVRAIDRAGNRSDPSVATQESVPSP